MNEKEHETPLPFRKRITLEQARLAFEDLQYLKAWRAEAIKTPELYLFYKFFEFSSFHKGRVGQENFNQVLDQFTANARYMSPRLRDLFFTLSAQLDGANYIPEFESTKKQLDELISSGDLSVLMGSEHSFKYKKNRMDKRFLGELLGKIALDKLDRDNQKKKEEHKSSMDEVNYLEKGENLDSRIAVISPHYGGYWKEQTFDLYQNGVWTHCNDQQRKIQDFDMRAGTTTQKIHWRKFKTNEWNRLSLPPHGFAVSIDRPNSEVYPKPVVHHSVDADGNDLFMPEGEGEVVFFIDTNTQDLFYKNRSGWETSQRVQNIYAEFTDETRAELEKIKAKKLKNIDAARAFLAYSVRRLRYPKKDDFNDGSLDQVLESHPNGKIGAIDRIKIADCDTAADYGAAGCSFLGIPLRLATGHFIQNPDSDGFCSLMPTNRHAWLEVYDEDAAAWEIVDFTPPGNPENERGEDSVQKGTYTPAEGVILTDEEIEQLEQQIKDRLMLTSTEEYAIDFAEETRISLEKAKDIINEVKQAEKLTLPSGEKIIDVLMKLFMFINEINRKISVEYTGPVKKSEGGGKIIGKYLVRHRLGLLSGQNDSPTRQLESTKKHDELKIKGFDLHFVHNRSASTLSRLGNKSILEHQRLIAFLINSAIAQIQERVHSAKSSGDIELRTQNISFLAKKVVSVDKPLSSHFSNQEKVELWDRLSKTGAGDADSVGLRHLLNQIRKEVNIKAKDNPEEIKRKVAVDGRLRIIILTTDGEPDDAALVRRLVEQLSELNALVLGVGITDSHNLANIESIYQTENGSQGVILKDVQDLAQIVARFIIERALAMLPPNKKAISSSFLKKYLRN